VIDTFAPLYTVAQPLEPVNPLKSNDIHAFEALFREFYNPLCRYANTFLNDKDDVKDIVQKVFIEIWEKREGLDIRVSLRSYLYRSVHNRCLNLIQSNKKFNKEVEMGAVALFAPDTDENIRQTELKKRIKEAMAKLPPQCARIFEMSRYGHLKYAEIAAQLELSVKTVENQMGKALKILRTELSDYLYLLIVLLLIK
jgi:RNA polymerase sigma-70 factor (family 1)